MLLRMIEHAAELPQSRQIPSVRLQCPLDVRQHPGRVACYETPFKLAAPRPAFLAVGVFRRMEWGNDDVRDRSKQDDARMMLSAEGDDLSQVRLEVLAADARARMCQGLAHKIVLPWRTKGCSEPKEEA